MDLGVQIEPQFGFSYADVLGIAREAETSGFRALWVIVKYGIFCRGLA